MQTHIDRKALVSRHNVEIRHLDVKSLLQVGNGEFSFGMDATGLQTLAGNIMAQWGWHTAPRPEGSHAEELELTDFEVHGRKIGYPISEKGQPELYHWLRQNPHRMSLGRLRILLDGKCVADNDLSNIQQKLELWTGVVHSSYSLARNPVEVDTCCHPDFDAVAIAIESPLIATGRLQIELAFPYGDPGISGAAWDKPENHVTELTEVKDTCAIFKRSLDEDRYSVALSWDDPNAESMMTGKHTFVLVPCSSCGRISLTCLFSKNDISGPPPDFASTLAASVKHWENFWNTGGVIDLSGSRDERWKELERRIVLSQYLLAVNEAGSLPPQESGLYNNSGWYGKFHLEMHWWHGAHWALWGRWELFAKSLSWYEKILPLAEETAKRQGYRGARWPKMIGPEGRESPSLVGPLLIWQQPHPIFYAELDFRLHPQRETLERWREIVFRTADFLASFAAWDADRKRFVLGPVIKTVPENNKAVETINPVYELQCWRFGLHTALEWRKHLKLAVEPSWKNVLDHLSEHPVNDGLYTLQEGMKDSYSKWNYEHPSQLGIRGMLPGYDIDEATMRRTVIETYKTWRWDECWGWDFPMAAMAAARNGDPQLAIEFLLHPSSKNEFDSIGLNTGGPFPYFPGNGGLLYAGALMAAGWDGSGADAPGFPEGWHVKYEGLSKAL